MKPMLSLLGLLWLAPALAQYQPGNEIGVALLEVAQGLDGTSDLTQQIFPTDLAYYPDGSGRLLVTTLGGVVRLIDDGALQTAPYLNTSGPQTINASNGNASFGLTTVAFHPDFAVPAAAGFGLFYTVEPEISRTSPPPDFPGIAPDLGGSTPAHDRVLYEYAVDDLTADQFSGIRREVLRIHEHRRGHDVNDLAFDAAGRLLISVGDTVVNETAQDLSNVFGTILRIDPLDPARTLGSADPVSANGQYRIPADNPWAGVSGAVPEIYVYGLRNPFRIHFDGAADELWVSSNGASSRESVYRPTAGANLGWPVFEGTRQRQTPPPGFVYEPPVFEYDHGLGVSVTGVVRYRGNAQPALQGRVIFSDFLGLGGSGARLWWGDPQTGQYSDVVSMSGPAVPATLVSLGTDAEGELYLLSTDGRVLRVVSGDVVFASGFE